MFRAVNNTYELYAYCTKLTTAKSRRFPENQAKNRIRRFQVNKSACGLASIIFCVCFSVFLAKFSRGEVCLAVGHLNAPNMVGRPLLRRRTCASTMGRLTPGSSPPGSAPSISVLLENFIKFRPELFLVWNCKTCLGDFRQICENFMKENQTKQKFSKSFAHLWGGARRVKARCFFCFLFVFVFFFFCVVIFREYCGQKWVDRNSLTRFFLFCGNKFCAFIW